MIGMEALIQCHLLVISKSLISREDVTLWSALYRTYNDMMHEMGVTEDAIYVGARVPQSSFVL